LGGQSGKFALNRQLGAGDRKAAIHRGLPDQPDIADTLE